MAESCQSIPCQRKNKKKINSCCSIIKVGDFAWSKKDLSNWKSIFKEIGAEKMHCKI